MTIPRTRLAPIVALLTAVPTLAVITPAQVPEGSAVIGTYTYPGAGYVPGTPGLFLAALDALPNTPPTRVAGLPPELSTDGNGAFAQGAHSVSHRSSDGAIIVGMFTGPLAIPSAGASSLWLLHLDSNATVIPALTQQILLGTASMGSRCWNCVLPDDRILVGASNGNGPFTNGPMAGHLVAIVDTSGSSPTVTPLPNPALIGGFIGGIVADPSGSYIYYTDSTALHGPGDTYVQRYDIVTGQTCLLATLNGESAFGIQCDDDGTVYVSATNVVSTSPPAFTHSIYAVRPDGCNPATVTAVATAPSLLAWGLDLDRASGRFVAGCYPGLPAAHFNAVSLIDQVTGAATVIAAAPANGWGTLGLQCVAVNNRIESYGASSPGQNHYWFDNFANPGGQPDVGNLGFTLTTESAPGSAAMSLISLSLGRGSAPLLGTQFLLDLTTTVSQFVASGPSVTYPLPIPNLAGLSGFIVTAQSLHLEANNGLAASRGLTLTIQ